MQRPLILVTNDDGIESEGLWAAARAVLPLGEVLIVAPDRQWSGAGRSMPHHVTGHLASGNVDVGGVSLTVYAVDATPALAVVHGVVELAPRRPDLVVSGINSGANLGTEVTVSGTVGAALEGGAFGIPALAVSLEMDPAYHLTGDDGADYRAAGAITRELAGRLLQNGLPYDVHALNVNVPADATPETPWVLARLARQRYFVPVRPDRKNGTGRNAGRPGYAVNHAGRDEVDSDVRTVLHERLVSVTPLSLDLTSRVRLDHLDACLRGEPADCLDLASAPPVTIEDLLPLPAAHA